MAELMIVAGECGRGSGEYDTGLFTLPVGGDRGAETIATVTVHGGVGEKQSTLGQVLTGLRGGLALAQQMDLTMPVTVAASALGAGLGALDSGPKQRALIEVVFQDGATLLAMTDVGIAALMENDRRVIQLAAKRFSPEPALIAPSETGIAAKVIASAEDAAHTAGSAVSGAFSFIKKTLGWTEGSRGWTGGEQYAASLGQAQFGQRTVGFTPQGLSAAQIENDIAEWGRQAQASGPRDQQLAALQTLVLERTTRLKTLEQQSTIDLNAVGRAFSRMSQTLQQQIISAANQSGRVPAGIIAGIGGHESGSNPKVGYSKILGENGWPSSAYGLGQITSLVDGSTKNEEAEAMRLGSEAGKAEKRFAGECPYDYTKFGLRFAWLDGFSKGRVELEKVMGTEPAAQVW